MDALLVKQLREATGVSIMECKVALEESQGDFEKAFEILRKKGIAKAEKKMGRDTGAGRIESYLHTGNQVGVLIDVRCETDFVARNEIFVELCHELALQVAAMRPRYVSVEEVPQEILAEERAIFEAELLTQNKPKEIMEKIIDGKLAKRFEELCLLEQVFVKDQDTKVKDMVKHAIAKLGENIVVKRFTRFEV